MDNRQKAFAKACDGIIANLKKKGIWKAIFMKTAHPVSGQSLT